MALRAVLERKRKDIIEQWLARTVQTYPAQTSRFLLNERDPFRNPVGEALKQGLPVLFDEIAGNLELARIGPVLDEIVRMRAVQDFTASQAVGFLFLLKTIVRAAVGGELAAAGGERDELRALEDRVDQLALLGFDAFVKCREKVFEIQADQAKRSVHLLKRAHPEFAPPEAEETSGGDPGRRPNSTRGDRP